MEASLTPSAAADRPDSIFSWVFVATSGDTWGGTWIADSDLADPGSTFVWAAGTYSILHEEERGIDLSPLGLEDQDVFVEFYWDGQLQQFLPTRTGPGTPVGRAGLGSELDDALAGNAWMPFGLGGVLQADGAALPRSRFTWSLSTSTGDRMDGTVIARAGEWLVGAEISGPVGTYRILAETNVSGPDDPIGSVRITDYWDAASRVSLPLQFAGVVPSGYEGLGSEVDRAWTGTAWQPVGQGGLLQADAQPDTVFQWEFRASSGDRYSGSLYARGDGLSTGDSWATPYGSYLVVSELLAPGLPVAAGTVWVTGHYDAGADRTLPTWYWDRLSTHSTTNGLGQELDAVWTGTSWAHFGLGGARQADAPAFSSYAWLFEANSGDRWSGGLWDSRTLYDPGSIVTTTHGRYVITSETPAAPNPGIQTGTVWVTSHYDAGADRTLPTWYWDRFSTHSTTNGLGQELDAVWTGTSWAHFGLGGARQADAPAFSSYAWVFEANSGDHWSGGLWDSRTLYDPGSIVTTTHGRYVITSETPAAPNPGIQTGTVWVTGYYDAGADRMLPTWYWDRFNTHSTTSGLGQELDAAWTGTSWAHFGLGGARQADAPARALDPWPG